jgi:Fe-S cluster assembly ATP-binding protein
MFRVRNLSASVADRELLHAVSFYIEKGETVVLLGPNGAGKSTLASALMGNPKITIRNGQIFDGKTDITSESMDARARRGLFLSHQAPVEIPGVSTRDFLRTVLDQTETISTDDFEARLASARKLLKLDPFFAARDLNLGLSGGEKKKNEVLQLLMLRPRLAILDEVDSGLDIDAAKTVSQALATHQKTTGCAYLIITHNFRVLAGLNPDKVLIMEQGRLVEQGDASLLEKIKARGFGNREV